MKIYAVYINGNIIYANKKEDLKVYSQIRHNIINPDISKLNINDSKPKRDRWISIINERI